MKTQRGPDVPATWREHFAIAPADPEAPRSELDEIQPGHTRGIGLLMLVMALGCLALIYGIARGF